MYQVVLSILIFFYIIKIIYHSTSLLFLMSIPIFLDMVVRAPLYAQVLLWLPGPLSVVVFDCKFAWVLCLSQTRPIHPALDGIQDRMASKLGFMSVVKQEVGRPNWLLDIGACNA